jgi:hypothetical protein
MNRKNRKAPQLEPLEGKLLLSTMNVVSRQVQAHVAPAFSLAGTLRMPASSVATFTQGTQTYGTFQLNGKLASVGQVTGTFVAPIDASNNMTGQGVLLFKNRRGTVNLTILTDAADNTTYDFTVKSGTGAFAAATGSGKMSTKGVTNNGRTMMFTVKMI